MKLLVLPFLLVAALALAACGGETADEPIEEMPMDDGMTGDDMMDGNGMDAPTTSGTVAEPRMEGGVQVVDVTVGADFDPDAIRLEAGVPARLVFTRTTDQTCVTEIKVPAFDVGPVDLPLGEPVAVEFTPDEAGDFTFTCGMDMVSGSLVVQS